MNNHTIILIPLYHVKAYIDQILRVKREKKLRWVKIRKRQN